VKVRWWRPVGAGSRVSVAFAEIDLDAGFEQIEPVASRGRWPVDEERCTVSAPSTPTTCPVVRDTHEQQGVAQ
jgi:hypothetical protein